MVTETAPGGSSRSAAEAEAPRCDELWFDTPLHMQLPSVQHAVRWAWEHHFRPLAADLAFCMTYMADHHHVLIGGGLHGAASDTDAGNGHFAH
jgi:hypothetical protein